MSKYCLVLMLLIAGSLGDNKSTACKLTVYKSPGQESLIGKSICKVFMTQKSIQLFILLQLIISIIKSSLLSRLNQ